MKRCLEKQRENRFVSAEDLAFALELAQETIGGPAGSRKATAVSQRPRRSSLIWAGVAVAVLAGGTWLARRGAEGVDPAAESATLTPLTVDAGDEADPSFAPDDETIAYASDRSGNYEIYLQQTSGGSAST